ncbi:MAG: hypothetical protein ABIG92_04450 [Candidatus Omnitrophota bacterium]
MKNLKSIKKTVSIVLVITFFLTSSAYSYEARPTIHLRSNISFGPDNKTEFSQRFDGTIIMQHYGLSKILPKVQAMQYINEAQKNNIVNVLLGDKKTLVPIARINAIDLIDDGDLVVGLNYNNEPVIAISDSLLTPEKLGETEIAPTGFTLEGTELLFSTTLKFTVNEINDAIKKYNDGGVYDSFTKTIQKTELVKLIEDMVSNKEEYTPEALKDKLVEGNNKTESLAAIAAIYLRGGMFSMGTPNILESNLGLGLGLGLSKQKNSSDFNKFGQWYKWVSSEVAMDDLNMDMFRDYDYRSVGPVLKPEMVFRLGLMWGQMALQKAKEAGIENRKVLIARDARKIEPELVEALAASLRYAGLDVVYTAEDGPNAVTSYSWAAQEIKPLMSIFITASHVSMPKDQIVRGFKVAMLNEEGGNLVSLTSKEIKNQSKDAVKDLIENPEKIKDLESQKKGSFIAANVDENCIRMCSLVGEVASSGGSLYDLARELESSDSPEDVITKWENKVGHTEPLKGMKVVVEGSHTPSGNLAANTFKQLGADVVLINGDILEVEGEHNADPSKDKNLTQLKQTIDTEGADFGIAFDLDGDRGAIVVPKRSEDDSGISFETLAPDRLIVSLLPYYMEKLGYDPTVTGKKVGVIRDVLGTFGVDDQAEALGIEAFQTDAGYVFLKAKRADLLQQGYGIPIYGELSGHTWQDVTGEFENPVAVAAVFSVMVKDKKYKEDNTTTSLNPFYEAFTESTIPYKQASRSQPLFAGEFLSELSSMPANNTGWAYNPDNPTKPPQLIIALGKDEGIKRLQKEFTVGKSYNTPAGELIVKEFNTYQDAVDEGGLYRFADIVFEQDGNVAGRFIFRASSNDPTFVCSFETPVWVNENTDSKTVNDRYISIGGIVFDWLEQNKIARVTGDVDYANKESTEKVVLVYRGAKNTETAADVAVISSSEDANIPEEETTLMQNFGLDAILRPETARDLLTPLLSKDNPTIKMYTTKDDFKEVSFDDTILSFIEDKNLILGRKGDELVVAYSTPISRSRRDFLKGLGAMAIGTSLLGFLASCEEPTKPKDPVIPDEGELNTHPYEFMRKGLSLSEVSKKAADWILGQKSPVSWVISYGSTPEHASDNIAWSFDQGTTMTVFSQMDGEYLALAKIIADKMVAEQDTNDDTWYDGYMGNYVPEKGNKLVGNIVSVGRGLVEKYLVETSETKYIESAKKAGDSILLRYWNTLGSDKGFFRGGLENGVDVSWASTEHNSRAAIFYYRLWVATGDDKYKDVALKIANWLKSEMWAGDHFHVGYDHGTNINLYYNQDADAQVTPILLFNMLKEDGIVGDEFDPNKFNTLKYLDDNYRHKITFIGTDGLKRTVDLYGKVKGIVHVWPEVSDNIAAVCQAWGNTIRKDETLTDIAKLQYVDGGIPYLLGKDGVPYGWTDQGPGSFPHPSIASSISFIAAKDLGPYWFPVIKRSTDTDIGTKFEDSAIEDIAVAGTGVAATLVTGLTGSEVSIEDILNIEDKVEIKLDGETVEDIEYLKLMNKASWLGSTGTKSSDGVYHINLLKDKIDPVVFSGEYVEDEPYEFLQRSREELNKNKTPVILVTSDVQEKRLKNDIRFRAMLDHEELFIVRAEPERVESLIALGTDGISFDVSQISVTKLIENKDIIMSYLHQK